MSCSTARSVVANAPRLRHIVADVERSAKRPKSVDRQRHSSRRANHRSNCSWLRLSQMRRTNACSARSSDRRRDRHDQAQSPRVGGLQHRAQSAPRKIRAVTARSQPVDGALTSGVASPVWTNRKPVREFQTRPRPLFARPRRAAVRAYPMNIRLRAHLPRTGAPDGQGQHADDLRRVIRDDGRDTASRALAHRTTCR